MALAFVGVSSVSFADASPADKGPDAVALEKGKVLFTQKAVPACAVCHTMADAGATGAIGPDLDELKPDLAQVKQAMEQGIGAMPSFAATLSEDDMNAVAAYVVHATGGGTP
ncbi:MAG TPA: cytochrome c [Eoetvoesiella sp.]